MLNRNRNRKVAVLLFVTKIGFTGQSFENVNKNLKKTVKILTHSSENMLY